MERFRLFGGPAVRKRAKDERRRINRSFNAFLLDSDEEVEESAVDYDGILTVNDDGEESDDDTPEERVFDEDSWSSDVKKLSTFIFEKESAIVGIDVCNKPFDFFRLFLNDELLAFIVHWKATD
ncbi:hypothetical protein OSTOST_02242 [Ostertagia ostertagi]